MSDPQAPEATREAQLMSEIMGELRKANDLLSRIEIGLSREADEYKRVAHRVTAIEVQIGNLRGTTGEVNELVERMDDIEQQIGKVREEALEAVKELEKSILRAMNPSQAWRIQ